MTVGFIPNLHIICPDPEGAVYIPTGKSLVRQLMATGLHTATKRMQLGKETLLQASIVGDQRFIKITSDVCKLFMDSGMVDLGNIGYLHPDFLGADGKLIYGSSQQGEKIYLGYLGSNLTNTRKLPLSGEAARSYKAAVYPKGHPQEGERDPGSEQPLALKKICSVWVTPSTFTGKMRMYVQAQYGSLLENFKFQPNAQTAPASLNYDSENLTYQLNPSNTGIYLDSNMNHWLVQIGINAAYSGGETVNITPMKASTCGEALRAKLRKLTPGTKQFDQVEAYILSTSHPVEMKQRWPNTAIVKPCPGVANRSNMGYGWKFNWSGSQADIISIETEWIVPDTTPKFRSHHLRISISRAPSELVPYKNDPDLTLDENAKKEWDEECARWTVSFGEVEVSAWWHNAKWFNVIAYPVHDEGVLAIFGTVLGGSYGNNVPIYCFYTRDNDTIPTVVRYSCVGGEAGTVEYSQTASDPVFAGTVDWNTSGGSYLTYNVFGYGGGWYSYKVRNTKPVVTTFAVTGANTTSVQVSTQSYQETKYESSDITLGEPVWYGWFLYGTWYRSTAFINATHTVTTSSTVHSEGAKMLCVIPFGDAEAVYLWGQWHEWGSGTGASDTAPITVKSVRWGETADNMLPGVPDPSTIVRTESLWQDTRGGAASTPYDPGYDRYTTKGSKSITNAGVHDFDPAGYVASAFFAGEPASSVSQQFRTNTSAIDGALWGAGVNVPQGYPKKGHAFIGWA